MKTIGILSLYDRSQNCGGVLQALAMEQVLQRLGFGSEQLLYRRTHAPTLRGKSPQRLIKRAAEKAGTALCRRSPSGRSLLAERQAHFSDFKSRYIRDSGIVYTADTIGQCRDRYDGFLCGSDQIWLPGSADPVRFLEFVPAGTPKFAYAVSIAAEIPSQREAEYRNAMNRLNHVSVRERGAQAQLSRLSGREIPMVLDPTLLLSREDWTPYAAPRPVPQPYILCYFLGGAAAPRRAARAFARSKGLPLVSLPFSGQELRPGELRFGDTALAAGPGEFLALIRDAAYVLTDSFHATALSLLFEKEFWAFRRSGYTAADDRVPSLLHLAGLEGRCLAGSALPACDASISYPAVRDRLEQARRASLDYLALCLKEIP